MLKFPLQKLVPLAAIVIATLPQGRLAAQETASSPAKESSSKTEAVQANGEQTASQQVIGRITSQEVRVSGAVELHQGEVLLGNGSTVTAADQAVNVALTRGGSLRLCSTTSLHLSRDRSVEDPQNTSLMMALDRGALEANYSVGKYSDVLLTPDLRILVSGPGQADLSIRVNTQGDTCIDNRGANAPYVVASSQLEGGLYRVMPGQRVLFEHGSLRDVVDREPEPCGCPAAPALSIASSDAKAKGPVGGPSSTSADTAFPLAESEGLAQPPAAPTKPVVPAGQPHAEVTVPLTYNGEHPTTEPATAGNTASAGTNVAQGSAHTAETSSQNNAPARSSTPVDSTAPASGTTSVANPATALPAPKASAPGGFFARVGHFFSRIFGG